MLAADTFFACKTNGSQDTRILFQLVPISRRHSHNVHQRVTGGIDIRGTSRFRLVVISQSTGSICTGKAGLQSAQKSVADENVFP